MRGSHLVTVWNEVETTGKLEEGKKFRRWDRKAEINGNMNHLAKFIA